MKERKTKQKEKSKLTPVQRCLVAILLIMSATTAILALMLGVSVGTTLAWSNLEFTFSDLGTTLAYDVNSASLIPTFTIDAPNNRINIDTNRQWITSTPWTLIIYDPDTESVSAPTSIVTYSSSGTEIFTNYVSTLLDTDTQGYAQFPEGVSVTSDFVYFVPFSVTYGNPSSSTLTAIIALLAQEFKPTPVVPPTPGGYEDGYNAGRADVENNLAVGVATINAVVSSPFNAISNALNFDVFGINLAYLFFFLVTILLIAFVLKIVISFL